LWGETAPPTATKVLQNHVGQLRRALHDREGRRLRTRDHGYLLEVGDDELDVERFEQLVDVGGEALVDGRPADAAARLGEALALWRGPALADVTYEEFARPEVVRLEERHAAAIEQRTEVGLNPTGVAAGLGAVWVANSGEQTITRIDPRSGGTTTIDVHAEPTEIAVGGGALWVTSADARTVSQLDPA
jgi:hypothetical protein